VTGPPEGRPALDLLESGLNRSLGALLLLIALPLFVSMALAVRLTSGPPVFHIGTRLGRNKKPFGMYKFRTLVTGAQQVIGGRLLSRQDDLTTPLGWLLRDTRLDELPQLLNILKGDMHFVGPRPVRPEVYEEQCAGIPGYDCRFAVKPGLIGYSQVFTPHNTPKRIRATIDNRMMSRRFRPLSDLLLITYTGLVVAGKSALRIIRFVGRDLLRHGIPGRYREKRRLSRVHPERAAAIVSLDGTGIRCRAPVVDISDTAFVMICGEALDPLPSRFELIIRVGRNGRTRRISAPCRGNVSQVRPTRDGYEYVIDFEPATDRSLYVLHQHFLKRSLAALPA
jgi:lipopolysaccharide/colanic/teichoic acid biosynthesis glycosyltransferase